MSAVCRCVLLGLLAHIVAEASDTRFLSSLASAPLDQKSAASSGAPGRSMEDVVILTDAEPETSQPVTVSEPVEKTQEEQKPQEDQAPEGNVDQQKSSQEADNAAEDTEAAADAVEAQKAAANGVELPSHSDVDGAVTSAEENQTQTEVLDGAEVMGLNTTEPPALQFAPETVLDNSTQIAQVPPNTVQDGSKAAAATTTLLPDLQVAPNTILDDSAEVLASTENSDFEVSTDGGKRSTRATPTMLRKSTKSSSDSSSFMSSLLTVAIPSILMAGLVWYSGYCRDASGDFRSLAADARTPKRFGRIGTPSSTKVGPFEEAKYSFEQ